MSATTTAPVDSCGCDEFRLSRRRFLAGVGALLGGSVVSGMVGDVFTSTAYGAVGGSTLVVLSLRGGADGISLVVPWGDPAYAAARPTIGVPAGSLLARDAMFGLHPGFSPLLPMWRSGSFGAVQAVGQPAPNRSHFSAMEAVESANPGSSARVGWLNRMVGQVGSNEPSQAVQLGDTLLPTSLSGPAAALATPALADLRLPGDSGDEWQQRMRDAMAAMWSTETSLTARAAQAVLRTTASLAPLASPADPDNGVSYPDTDLGKALAGTARVIRAQVGARVVTLDFGDWDMHTDLGTVDRGNLHDRVAELASALAAFFQDLGSAADKVTLVTLSEFGRRIEENGGYGVDHGYGNAMLLLGANVRGGQVHGRWPGLGSDKLVDGDLAVTTDYRSVLSEVVGVRFPDATLSTVFPGFTPQAVGAVR